MVAPFQTIRYSMATGYRVKNSGQISTFVKCMGRVDEMPQSILPVQPKNKLLIYLESKCRNRSSTKGFQV